MHIAIATRWTNQPSPALELQLPNNRPSIARPRAPQGLYRHVACPAPAKQLHFIRPAVDNGGIAVLKTIADILLLQVSCFYCSYKPLLPRALPHLAFAWMFALRYTSKTHITRAAAKLSLGARIGHTYTCSTAANTTKPALSRPPAPPIRSFTTTPPTMAPLTAWTRLIRYVSAKDGSIKYGEPIISSSDSKYPDIDALAQAGGLKVKVLSGSSPILAKATGEEDEVKSLLGPLEPKDVPIVRCVGLNYKTHSKSPTSLSLSLSPILQNPTNHPSSPQSSKPASTSPPTPPSSSSPRTPSPTPAAPSQSQL